MNIVFTRSSTIYDDSRSTKEILAFLESGYRVTVLGWDRNGTAVSQCRKLFADYGNRISCRFYSGKAEGGFIGKLLSRIKWSSWLKKELSKEKKIDVIHACDYDTGKAVRSFALKKKVKYVYDIFDYYIDAHPVPGFLRGYIENGEIKNINHAEMTIICTEERREQIKKSVPKKVLVIHNSPDIDEVPAVKEEYDYSYCGSMNNGRLIGEILDRYPKNSRFRFIYAGNGKYSETARALAAQYDTFDFLGPIPYEKVLEAEQKSKVISAIYEPVSRNHQLCAPNKFYEALALGKAVIVCKGTGIDKIVERHKLGCVINYDAEEFYNALDYLSSHDAVRTEMGRSGRKLYEENYRWSIMKEKLIGAYSKIV